MKKIIASLFLVFFATSFFNAIPQQAFSAESKADPVVVHFFGRDDCKFCRAEKSFFDSLSENRDDYELRYYNIVDDESAKTLFNQLTTLKQVSKITPVTVIGTKLFQGFNSPETTGAYFISAIDTAKTKPPIDIETFIFTDTEALISSGSGCDVEGGFTQCSDDTQEVYTFDLPLVGVVNLEEISLSTLSLVLGFVDGFNPCAMWVLITFLLILSQIGDKKKMIQVVGLFLVAEAVMYNLILNVWFHTWDFVGLDQFVTPIVGLVALGGGIYFLYRFFKTRNSAMTCDIGDNETHDKIEKRIKKYAVGPLTIISAIGIIGIALSINIIEFACSIGIPQAFTKILELNELNMFARQLQMLLYTIAYMIDDLIVFGIALYGFSKLHSNLSSSYKYARWSSLIGGILMVCLGLLLLLFPDVLVF